MELQKPARGTFAVCVFIGNQMLLRQENKTGIQNPEAIPKRFTPKQKLNRGNGFRSGFKGFQIQYAPSFENRANSWNY